MNSYRKICVTALLITGLQGCGNPEEKVQDYIDSGKALYEKEDYQKARLEFKNALQIDYERAEAHFYLGLIFEENKSWQPMFRSYLRAVQFDPKHIAARLKLGEIFVNSKQPDKALEQANAILAIEPENPDALELKGRALLSQSEKNVAEAEEFANKALEKNPNHVRAIGLKAFCSMAKEDYKVALNILDNAIKTQPQVFEFYALKLQINNKQKDLVAIEQSYLDIVKQFPTKFEFTEKLAQFYVQTTRKEKGEKLLEETIKANPKEIKLKLAHLDYLAAQKPTLLKEFTQKYLELHPDVAELYFRLAGLYFKDKELNHSKELLQKVIAIGTSDEILKAKANLAKIALLEKDKAAMDKYVAEILEIDPNHLDARILKAADDMTKGLYEKIISDLREVIKNYPNSDDVLVLLAQAYARNKSPELALENYRKALDLNPANFQAVMPVVAQMIQSKDLDRAEKTLLKALSSDPNHAGGLQILAQIRLLKQDWEGTQSLADFIATRVQGKGYSDYLSGVISQGQGDCKTALEKFQEALEESPGLAIALKGIVTCYQSSNQSDKALEFLNQFSTKHAENFYPEILKAHIYITNKQQDKAIAVLKKAITKWSKTTQLYDALATLYINENELVKAIDVYQQGLKIMPEYLKFRLNVAFLYQNQKKYEKTLAEYEYILDKAPKAETVINNLAALLLDYFRNEENIKRALALTERFKESKQPYFVDTYAWALLHSGKAREALDIFKKVVVEAKNVPVFHYHLGYAYAQLGDKINAIMALNNALELSKQTGFEEKQMAEQLLEKLKEEDLQEGIVQ